jgi:hypothetical protein
MDDLSDEVVPDGIVWEFDRGGGLATDNDVRTCAQAG